VGAAVRGVAGRHEDLEGKIVVITGAGSGIGRATAAAFARQRSTVDEVAAEVDGLGARGVAVPCDVTDEDSVAALAGAAELSALHTRNFM
jgi:NAD(P)-dependent dehydrogenase (short-subunit alcohol dehydrogenase family)